MGVAYIMLITGLPGTSSTVHTNYNYVGVSTWPESFPYKEVHQKLFNCHQVTVTHSQSTDTGTRLFW